MNMLNLMVYTKFEVNQMKTKKTNVFNDGVKNAEEKQDIGKRPNVPIGKKNPEKSR